MDTVFEEKEKNRYLFFCQIDRFDMTSDICTCSLVIDLIWNAVTIVVVDIVTHTSIDIDDF